jgi:3-oxoacyl-[acyl-carrier-protein] synthase II
MFNCCAGLVSIRYGLRGLSVATGSACSSSGHAIFSAMHEILRGDADVMVAGGAEAAVTPVCISAFMRMKALSTRNAEPARASRPFDRDRDGFVLAEGAAAFVLESEEHARRRGARPLAVLAGAGVSSDAGHITAPDPKGAGALLSMRRALAHAGLAPGDVDYVNAHGTSTPLGDGAEVAAVKALFGDHARGISISSTKSMHGHYLGASGAVETIACIGALQHGVVPPTINLDRPDEGFDLDFVPHKAKERRVRVAMNNTFGFGGHNVTLILARA